MRVRHVRRSQLPESIVNELRAPCERHATLVAELGSGAQLPAGAAVSPAAAVPAAAGDKAALQKGTLKQPALQKQVADIPKRKAAEMGAAEPPTVTQKAKH